MGIVFFCQSCGARFEVEARMAGKKGRCKKCGQVASIPKAEHLASMVSMPALAVAGVGAVAVPRASSVKGARAAAGAQSMGDWLKASMSKVGLAPLTYDGMAKRVAKPSPLDDAEDSKPYVLQKPDRRDARGHEARPANALVVAWKHEWGLVGRIFRWLNESAYLASIPFIIILLFGIAVKARPIALFGATFVVLLNIGRFAAGIANLAVVPIRDGLNVRKLKKPARRVIEPVLTVALVVLAFTFIPWLSNGSPASGSISDRIRATAGTLKKEIAGEVGAVAGKTKNLNLDDLSKQVQTQFQGAIDKAASSASKLGSPSDEKSSKSSSDAGESPKPESSLGGLIKDAQRGREMLKEVQKEP